MKTLIQQISELPPASACATSRRSVRCVSTTASNSTVASAKASANSISRSVSFKILFALILTLVAACSGEKEFVFDGSKLHGPLAINVIPGTGLALVVSTNFDFANSASNPQEPAGAIMVLDLAAGNLIAKASVQISNFAGQLKVDPIAQRIYMADRDEDDRDFIRVFAYTIPGTGGKPIDIAPVKNIKVGKDPFAVFVTKPTGVPFTKVFAANIDTSDLSVINASTLKAIDLEPEEDDAEALPLDKVGIGSLDFTNQTVRPNRIVPFGSDDLFLLSTTVSGLLYVIDAKNNGFEAIYNLQSIDANPSLHGMAITPAKLAFVATQGGKAVLVLDLSGLSDDGVDNEVLIPPLIQTIPTGSDIEDMLTSADGTKVYAAEFSKNSLLVLDAVTGSVRSEVPLGQGPTEMALNDAGTMLYITNFLSDTISVVDTATDTVVDTIK